MYRALKPLKIRTPNTSLVEIEVGAEVPGFAGWPQWTQQAMLQQGQVRWAPEGLAPHEVVRGEQTVQRHMPTGVADPAAQTDPKEPGLEPALVAAVQPKPAVALAPASTVGEPLMDTHGSEHLPDLGGLPAAVPIKKGESIYQSTRAAPLGGLESKIQVGKVPAEKGAHDCHLCDRKGFKDYNGLRIHQTRAHKPKE